MATALACARGPLELPSLEIVKFMVPRTECDVTPFTSVPFFPILLLAIAHCFLFDQPAQLMFYPE